MSEEEKQKGKPDEVGRETLIQKKKLFYKSSKKQRTLNEDDIEVITIQVRGSGSALLRSLVHLPITNIDTDPTDPILNYDLDPTDAIRRTDADITDVIRH